ncbi:hypothetical protein QTI66_01335 [Variovorax sp. J22R133]|uniref:hypothetical protein n=1 Tax=Variovorax brevis TaxID=3053503 RepID=UPI002574C003|nr:hypothetical protein [Variovorax sp. J22R133]MDM0110768.1 hypothetical protein [Variovorax sp. J22R133]
MHWTTSPLLLASCCILAACGATPGTIAPLEGRDNCVAAAARYYKVPADNFRVDGSNPSSMDDVYDVQLTNTATGRRSKCTVDTNGNVTSVINAR